MVLNRKEISYFEQVKNPYDGKNNEMVNIRLKPYMLYWRYKT